MEDGLPKKVNGGSKSMEGRMLGEWEVVEERLLREKMESEQEALSLWGWTLEGRGVRERRVFVL